MVEAGLHEKRRADAIRKIDELLKTFNGIRPLTTSELSTYKPEFIHGWELPEFFDKKNYRLRLLLKKTFPFSPPRIAVWPAPQILDWPNLEEDGLLCLIPESATHSIEDTESVVLQVIADAKALINQSIAGENLSHFEEEFQSYWNHWNRRATESMSVLCFPKGPSRWVSAWRAKHSTIIAEDDKQVLTWIKNRFGRDNTEKEIVPQPIPLIWLARPPRPDEYPANVGALLGLLSGNPPGQKMVRELLLNHTTNFLAVLLGFNSRRGAGFAGLIINRPTRANNRSGDPLTKGFRRQPPQDILLVRYNAGPINGTRVTRYDPSWIHGRDHNPDVGSLMNKSVVIFGLGSIGSTVAELLAKAGVGKMTLVDPDSLGSENISRHALGAQEVGDGKAGSLAHSLTTRFPHLTIDGLLMPLEEFVETAPDRPRSADLVISTTGNWSAESFLNSVTRDFETFPPILYGWTEPHAAAGHATVFFKRQGCLRCITGHMGELRLAATTWPNEGTILPVPACGGFFQPYGAVELTYVHALVAKLALDVLTEQVKQSVQRTWIGPRKLISRSGGSWNQAWIEQHGDPGIGGTVIESSIIPDPICPECSQIQ